MKKIFTLIAFGICTAITAVSQTYNIEDHKAPAPFKEHVALFSGDGPLIGLNEYGAGIDFRHSSNDRKVLQNPGVAIPEYTYDNLHSTAFGINQTDHMSIVGGFLAAAKSKVIVGDIINLELGYGHISTNDASQADHYFLNHGSSWFVMDYELGLGFMSNFSQQRQFGATFVFLKGALDRSYPANRGGRANSYTEFRYRYKRLLSELTLEGPGFGLGGLKHPEIIGLSCKLLQRHTKKSRYSFAKYLGLCMEYMNVTQSYTGGGSDHFRMLNFRITCGYIL